MNTADSSHIGGPAHEIDNRICRFHSGDVAHIATSFKPFVAISERDRFRACRYVRYMLSQWLIGVLEQTGLSQAALARDLTSKLGRSIDRAAVNKMTKGTRAIHADELIAIQEITGATAPVAGLRSIAVKGSVQAGAWKEAWEWDESSWYSVGVQDLEALRPFNLYAAELRGTSMNRRYAEGTVLIYTDIVETGEDLIVGKRYIVERERSDGEREATVKTLAADDDGNYWLMPESDDPRFQEALDLSHVEDETIRILGRVHFAVTKE